MIAARGWVIAAAILYLVCACGTRHELAPLPVVEVAGFEPAVRSALTNARAQLDRVAAGKSSDADLANAYGDLAMSYHAHSLVTPAETAYANARLLAPVDKRWP